MPRSTTTPLRSGFARAALAGICLCQGCGPAPVTTADVTADPPPAFAPTGLQVGAARFPITPTGRVFLAGGIPWRPALAVHDDLWATAIVLDDGHRRVALVSLDLIGLFYEEVSRIRRDIARQALFDYVLIACTHTHNAPDVLGLWSPDFNCLGDPYLAFVRRQTARAVQEAALRLRPARLRVAVGDSGPLVLARDTRPPDLIDDTLVCWQAEDAESGETICTSIHYGVHPILVPSLNFDISSDFAGFLRDAIENGFRAELGEVQPRGGLCAFFNGALGGRVVPALADPLSEAPAISPAHARAQGYGYRLALRAQELLDRESRWLPDALPISVRTRGVVLPVGNPIMSTAITACALDRSLWSGGINSEVGILRVGPLCFLAVPGMIFPELVLGSTPPPLPGSDFADAPLESPSLADLAGEDIRIVVGLANDMCGYIIPRSQYDALPPFTTGTLLPPYGEIISAGPDTAAILLDAFARAAASN